MKKKILLGLSLVSVGILMGVDKKGKDVSSGLTIETGSTGVVYRGPYSPTAASRKVFILSKSRETLNELVTRLDGAGRTKSTLVSEYTHKCARVLGGGMYVYNPGGDTHFYVGRFAEGDSFAGSKVLIHPDWIKAEEVSPVLGE
ncbi:hypothetical protein HOM50_01670 [bacterium]|jgi:hypothetical protein|nr:hypothetical protein [bacterium]MBT5015095.1 hypothetical protein [bacterium]